MGEGKKKFDTKLDIRIKELDSGDISLWNQYIMENSMGTFYHRIEWKQVIEKSFHHKTYYLMALQSIKSHNSGTIMSGYGTINSHQYTLCESYNMQHSNKVVGILPMVHIKSLIFGSIFCSMPFLNFAGVCSDNEEVESLLINAAERILKDKKGDYLELRNIKRSCLDIPVKTHKVSMTIELNSDPEILWKRFSTKHRTNIRRVAKNGLAIRFGNKNLLRDFYSVMSKGWKHLGTPLYNYSFFKNIVNAFGNSVEISVVTFQDKPIAAAFNGFFKDTVEGMWLSTLPAFEKLSPSYFLYWEMIKRMCERGYKYFHLGRSNVDGGGEFFKKKWNAEPRQLYWEYILNRCQKIPELNIQNPKYQFAIRLWKRLPLTVTRILGPIIAKSIP